MRVRAMDSDGDMKFGLQQADFFHDQPEGVAQIVGTRLRLWRGEWFLDVTEGMPWSSAVLGMHRKAQIEPAIRARVATTPGVSTIDAFSLAIDPDTRIASVSVDLSTIYGAASLGGNL